MPLLTYSVSKTDKCPWLSKWRTMLATSQCPKRTLVKCYKENVWQAKNPPPPTAMPILVRRSLVGEFNTTIDIVNQQHNCCSPIRNIETRSGACRSVIRVYQRSGLNDVILASIHTENWKSWRHLNAHTHWLMVLILSKKLFRVAQMPVYIELYF